MSSFEAMTPEGLFVENAFDARAYGHQSSQPHWQEAIDVEQDFYHLVLTEGLITGNYRFIGSAMQDPLDQVMLGIATDNTTERGEI